MDGRQAIGLKHLVRMHSLQRKLTIWMVVCITAVALLAGVVSFISAFREAYELQDDQLRQLAVLLNHHQIMSPATLQSAADNPLPIDAEARIFIQDLNLASIPAVATPGKAAAAPALHLAGPLQPGLQTVLADGTYWRVFVVQLADGHRLALAQDTELRNEIALGGAMRTLLPFVVLIPLLVYILRFVIGRVFSQVHGLAHCLDSRDDTDLEPIDTTGVPDEIRPFVDAINRLLDRVARALDARRRFIADAAHELRTPLTALSLQVESIDMPTLTAPARLRVERLRAGLQRTRSLIEQLLSLARAQNQGAAAGADGALLLGPVDINSVFRDILEVLMPLADAKEIDIGVIEPVCVPCRQNATDIHTLVKNLVDNAIRYTPGQGQIDLQASRSGDVVVIIVTDSGPGIPEDEMARVFDPFYRVPGSSELGSGLGLSIVQNLCVALHGQVSLANRYHDGQIRGLVAEVRFPAGDN